MYKEKEIIAWAESRGILANSTALVQSLKTYEETAELVGHHLKNESITDDIGDIYVTLVIVAYLSNTNLDSCNTPDIDWRSTFYVAVGLAVLSADLIDDTYEYCEHGDFESSIEDIQMSIGDILSALISICKLSNLNINECIDEAYNVITKRKGKLVNGLFVKDN